MIQNWGYSPFAGQATHPFALLGSAPQAIQLLQIVPQQLQQLQQLEWTRQQQLQQIQQLLQYVAYQLQVTAQHQTQQPPLGALGSQGLGQPFQTMGANVGSAFSTPPLHVM
jgi:hypothetical protein